MRCQLFQWILWRRIDRGGPLPRWLRAHVADCPACRDAVELDRRLRAEAPASAAGAPAELEDRIRAAIRRRAAARPADAPSAGAAWPVRPAAALACAVVVLGIVSIAFHFSNRPEPVPTTVVVQDPAPEFEPWPVDLALWDAPSHPAADTLLHWLSAQPLEREWQLIRDDLQRLAHHARLYLPEDPAQTP